MLNSEIERQLEGVQRVLVFGCGGGYDVVCGLPLAHALEARGITVDLASCSFTGLDHVRGGRRMSEGLLAVDADCVNPGYFPEGHLCRWARKVERRERRVFCFNPAGLEPYRDDVSQLVEELQPEMVLLVDGGVDSLVSGAEFSLGTPLLDALTLAACEPLAMRKVVATTAFGAERWDKISHAQVFARIAELTGRGALRGVCSLTPQSREGQLFVQAVEFLFGAQPEQRPSIVASAMLAALDGRHGEQSLNSYTEQTPLWLSPLLLLYWLFDLDAVCESKRQLLTALTGSQTREQAAEALRTDRDRREVEPWQSIPL